MDTLVDKVKPLKSPLAAHKKPAINIVWLKRDLRLTDHQPICNAFNAQHPVLFLYVFETETIQDGHYDMRHWRFVWQSLQDMQNRLAPAGGKIHIVGGNVIDIFTYITHYYQVNTLFSHEETGLDVTYKRDKELAKWTEKNSVKWLQSPTGAVSRGLMHRTDWDKTWQKTMRQTPTIINYNALPFVSCSFLTPYKMPSRWLYGTMTNTNTRVDTSSNTSENTHKTSDNSSNTTEAKLKKNFNVPLVLKSESKLKPKHQSNSSMPLVGMPSKMQTGGMTAAHKTLDSFYLKRGQNYNKFISKPLLSRTHCSRMSPYLAWGNISLREMYQTVLAHWQVKGWRRALVALASRLHWHCHFIQKFESESSMEFYCINQAYEAFPYLDINQHLNYLKAWEAGRTGVPLVDACMRCLIQTGYLNFRMRSMLVSFLTHHLLLDWRHGVKHLAKLFLDFEPGIHYPQFQMQAGVTGINTIRIYNPIKQSQEHDSEALFIKKWLPELIELPTEFAHQPWLMTPLEQQMYQVILGVDYPEPIIDLTETGKRARDLLWGYRAKPSVKKHKKSILAKHVRPNR